MRTQMVRVWNKKTEEMIKEAVIVGNKGDKITLIEILNDKTTKLWFVEPKDIEVMHPTWFKDKNDNEIYEGDIITIKVDEDDYGCDLGEIEFQNGIYVVEYINVATHPEYLHEITLEKEVVGNVYENPQLLEIGQN